MEVYLGLKDKISSFRCEYQTNLDTNWRNWSEICWIPFLCWLLFRKKQVNECYWKEAELHML